MKRIKLLLILNILFHSIYGQNYIEYYHLCNDADEYAYSKKYDLALHKLEAAFELVDYVHTVQYEKAGKLSIKVHNFEKAYFFIRKSILNGNKNHFWKGKGFRKFRKSKYYRQLIDNIVDLRKQSLQSINLNYKIAIDSLYFIDQNIIRKNKRIKGKYNIDKSQFPEKLYDLDSKNLDCLLELIKIHGFPSERIIGIQGYEKAVIIIQHNLRLEQNKEHHPMAIKAVYNGEYLPKDFAPMYEQYSMWNKSRTFFTTWDKNLSEDNLRRINGNRLKFGLKDLSAFKIKRMGRVMKVKW